MPTKLPEDLFASETARVAESHLKMFLNGEITRNQVLEEVIDAIRQELEIALNTIASNQGFPPDAQKIEK